MNNQKAFRVYLIYRGAGAFLFSFIYLALAVYYVVTARLDPLQLVLVGTVLEGTIFLFEVPTGVVADTFSRRLSVICGQILLGLGFILEGLFPVFGAILLGEVVRGIGHTFVSGAESAWIADEVGEENIGEAYLRASQVSRVCGVAGVIASMGLASVQTNLPVIIGGVLFVCLGLFLALRMPETGFKPAPREGKGNWQAMGATFHDGLRVVRRRPVLLNILAIGFIIGLASEGIDRLGEAHLIRNIGFPTWGDLQPVVWLGIMDIGLMPLAILGAEVVRRRVDMNDPRVMSRVLFVLSAVRIGGILAFALAGGFYAALLAVAIMAMTGSMMGPVYDTWLTQSIEPRVRATVLSMGGQLNATGQVAGGPLVGAIGSAFSIRAALMASGVLLSPVLVLYGRLAGRKKGEVVLSVESQC